MPHASKPSIKKVLEFTMSHDALESQLVRWMRGVAKSNDELVLALERLRHSYRALLARTPVTDAEQVLWQVDGALKGADRSRNMFVSRSDHEPQGA
jgi:hypothetical protein